MRNLAAYAAQPLWRDMTDTIVTDKPKGANAQDNTEGKVPPEELVVFAKRLRVYRAENRYSQKDIAAMTGLTQGMVSDIELCKGNPTFNSLKAVSRTMGTPLYDLLKPE